MDKRDIENAIYLTLGALGLAGIVSFLNQPVKDPYPDGTTVIEYEIKEGTTVWGIAKYCGKVNKIGRNPEDTRNMFYDRVSELNPGADFQKLEVGSTLKVPAPGEISEKCRVHTTGIEYILKEDSEGRHYLIPK